MDAKSYLFLGLGVVLVLYVVTVVRGGMTMPNPWSIALGFVTAFLDTLGIGSFATTTTAFRFWNMVPVKLIPGTLNVGHTLSTIAQAFIYTKLVPVDSTTLVLMIAAAVVGSWVGVGVVVRWPKRKIQIGMGIALLGAATIFLLQALNKIPGGGDAHALTGVRLAIGLAGNFVLGVLMMLGIGLYGPCMILVSLLGMSETTAFPIMMGSCALLMPAASVRFVREGAYDPRAALALTLAGIPGVLVAAFIVRSLPLGVLRWLVVGVVVYTAVTLLAAARAERSGAA